MLFRSKPRPQLNSLSDSVYCNGELMPQVNFNSNIPATVFNWNCSNNIGIAALNGTGSVPSAYASNSGSDTIFAIFTVIPEAFGCQGNSKSFKVTVKDSPPEPQLFALLNNGNSVCGIASNISFSITNPPPDKSIQYLWSTNIGGVTFGDSTFVNNVLSFNYFTDTTLLLTVTATYDSLNGGCKSAAYMTINVIASGSDFGNRKIFEKNPGHLLIYPDNSMDGYLWGYDTIYQGWPKPQYGFSVPVANQVYQFFIPESRFINQDKLDTLHYAFWVMLIKDDCRTKVYYNGLYAKRSIETEQADNTPLLIISSNPNHEIGRAHV